jgi:hypothetical protein
VNRSSGAAEAGRSGVRCCSLSHWCAELTRPSPPPLRRFGCAQEGWTPLHRAAHGGKAAVVAALLERGADVNTKDNVRRATRRRPAPRAAARAWNRMNGCGGAAAGALVRAEGLNVALQAATPPWAEAACVAARLAGVMS